jgi:NAD-dependent dihydropyrimidine dehydrogenase PreA subunit
MREILSRIVPTLGRMRLLVQLFMLWLLVYGSSVVGYYAAEKISGTLPALSCAYDKRDGDYCVLIPTQHILHHRIGEAIAQGQEVALKMLLPLGFTVLSFFVFFVLLNKMFCGWICPLGTLQELVYRLGRLFRLDTRRLEERHTAKARPVKWLLLVLLVLALPLAAGLGVTPHETGDAFCQVCPSRLATTLLTGDAEQAAIHTGGLGFAFGAVANTLFGFVLVGALALRQPFCRICPLLAFNAFFQRTSPMRLVKQQHDRCAKCGICHEACPMDIHEIWQSHGRGAFHEDCTLCGRCAEFCPDDGVISIKLGPLTLFRSAREYYKRRIRRESPHGEMKTIVWHDRKGRKDHV